MLMSLIQNDGRKVKEPKEDRPIPIVKTDPPPIGNCGHPNVQIQVTFQKITLYLSMYLLRPT